MVKKGLIFVVAILLFAGFFNKTKSQISNSIAIVLNEYSMGNYLISDNYGVKSDWVEILNNHTFSVSLGGYFLSNDRNNLYKWQFPNTYTLGVGGIGIVYLTGKNEARQIGNNWFYHASFNIDQCKNQWLILTTPNGVIRDSVFVQKTMAGHTRGRLDRNIMGVQGWRVYTVHSFSLANPPVNYYKDYLPMPTFTPQAGWGHIGESLDMFLGGSNQAYDSSDTLNCYEIHYTTNGCVPTVTDPVYTYTSAGLCGGNPLIILDNMVVRAVTFPKQLGGTCDPSLGSKPYCYPDLPNYLPSFCQTNTYFSDINGSFDQLDPRFSVMAVTIGCADTNWFRSPAAYDPSVHVEYFDNKTQWTEGYGALHKPIQEAWATGQRGFYVNIDDRRGFGCNFEGNIFNNACLGTTSRTLFPTLHVSGGDFESHSRKNGDITPMSSNGTGIRDVFAQSLAIKYKIDVNPLHMKPMILFVNGMYQGAFNLREVYDWYYTSYYKGQPRDSIYLQRYHQGVDSYVEHFEEDYRTAYPFNNPLDRFKKEVYDYAATYSGAMGGQTFYNTLMSRLDKSSFIDYHVMNSYFMNSDLWNNNVAFGRGLSMSQPGERWHYYLWNMPAVMNFTAINTNTLVYNNPFISPCASYTAPYNPSPLAGNSHGRILSFLMHPVTGNKSFQLEYKNRYMDLLNGAFKCENILSHYDCVVELFQKEMKFHEDPSSLPNGTFTSVMGDYDTNTTRLRKIIEKRCDFVMNSLGSPGNCYGAQKLYNISIDVYPPDAGKVKLNTEILPSYKWQGSYYSTQMNMKAIPTTTSYVFHHWEIKQHVTKNNAPLSLDSIAIDFNQSDEVVAYFTDVTQDIVMPTGFTPNGDGNNDIFRPQGSALFTSEYEFRIWNRWGQEVFRSTSPEKGWDGYYESRLAQTGVYAYVITYKNIYNEPKVLKGNVTLLR